RFASVAMDERHLIGAIRDAALNPVRARCDACGNGKWSSVHSHPARKDDGLVTVAPVLRRIADFTAFIAEQADDTGFAALRRAEQAGRPVDTADFIKVASAFSSGGLRGGTRPQAGGNDRGAGAAVIDSR
ncbi:MAG TPA: hypothetical protein VMF67_13465, partial [Rhizomicrobium sp.]|nr:hypothetical protein [Rhizomicrobium sp.]